MAKSELTLTLRQWDRTDTSDPEWFKSEFQRIAGMIEDGYTSGEIVGAAGERGWWDLSATEPQVDEVGVPY